jgi:hypothetical protein
VRRIEDYLGETVIGEWQLAEVGKHVRADHQLTPVTKRVFFAAHITEYGAVILFIEPKHPGAAAHI